MVTDHPGSWHEQEEDYDLDYEDDDDEEEDGGAVDVENKYYGAKSTDTSFGLHHASF